MDLKKEYRRPELVEYGRMDQLTLGATGPDTDYSFSGGKLSIATNSPVCTSNTGACLAQTS